MKLKAVSAPDPRARATAFHAARFTFPTPPHEVTIDRLKPLPSFARLMGDGGQRRWPLRPAALNCRRKGAHRAGFNSSSKVGLILTL